MRCLHRPPYPLCRVSCASRLAGGAEPSNCPAGWRQIRPLTVFAARVCGAKCRQGAAPAGGRRLVRCCDGHSRIPRCAVTGFACARHPITGARLRFRPGIGCQQRFERTICDKGAPADADCLKSAVLDQRPQCGVAEPADFSGRGYRDGERLCGMQFVVCLRVRLRCGDMRCRRHASVAAVEIGSRRRTCVVRRFFNVSAVGDAVYAARHDDTPRFPDDHAPSARRSAWVVAAAVRCGSRTFGDQPSRRGRLNCLPRLRIRGSVR